MNGAARCKEASGAPPPVPVTIIPAPLGAVNPLLNKILRARHGVKIAVIVQREADNRN